MFNLEIIVLDQTKTSKLLYSRSRRESITHIVSIHDPNHKPASGFFQHPGKKLRLEFEDETVVGIDSPTEDHIKSILNFAKIIKQDLDKNDCKLLIHCYAGISRSTAAAFILLCSIFSDKTEKECFEEILRIRPIAKPNRLMVEFADNLLDRKNKMLEAIYRSASKIDQPEATIFNCPPVKPDPL